MSSAIKSPSISTGAGAAFPLPTFTKKFSCIGVAGVSLDTMAGGVSVAVPAPVGAVGVSLDCGGGNPAPVPVGGRAGIL